MNKKPIPSRNRKVTHADFCMCPFCRKKIKYDLLNEDDTIHFLNEIIIYCPYCGLEQIPDVTINIEYKYS